MDVAGKVAVITGASGGIGLAAARLFSREGARVGLAARSVDTLDLVAAELPGSLAIPTDMRDETAIHAMIDTVARQFGRLDILVNNAGQGMHTAIERADPSIYRSLLELNVVGVLIAMQAAIPLMRRQGGGAIVNISSGTTKMNLPGVGPYASTKHALNGLTLAARVELASDGISVGLVYPFVTATAFHSNLAAADPQPATRSRALLADSAEYVAELILEAVRTGAAEVFAASVKRGMESRGDSL